MREALANENSRPTPVALAPGQESAELSPFMQAAPVAADQARPFSCRICGALHTDPETGWGAVDPARGPWRPARNGDPTELDLVLDLGRTPLANRLLRPEQLHEPEPTYPLALVFCNRCSLLQINETVPPEILFRDYVYFSSFSDTMVRHAQRQAERLIADRSLGAGSLVVEAASNDGYLLQHFARHGIPVLGIEPARNIAAVARSRGIETVNEFFDTSLVQQLRADGKSADVFLANNVLAHVADLNDFVRAVRMLLAPEGIAVLEAPYAKDMIDHCEFDTIYHEHLCYFSLTALDGLFRQHGMTITDVERIPIHGGSLRIYAGHSERTRPGRAVTALLQEESGWGVDRLAFYEGFARRVTTLKASLRELLASRKRGGKRIAAYGASAKGSTLLNYFGIGRETLDFVADRSTVKQGHFTPGTHLPIFAPQQLLEVMPDYVLLLTWNFADEILQQQEEYRRRGGKFIIPIPNGKVI